VDSGAFSPDGKLVASGSKSGTLDGFIRLWRTATGQPVGPTFHIGSETGAGAVAFSPSGKLLASGDSDGTVRLWNLATGQPVGLPIQTGTGPQGGLWGMAFTPNDKLLASVDGNAGTVRLWDISLFSNPYASLCASAGAPTRAEWNRYAPHESEPKICS
jgi:WD40 repeat protein